MHWLEKKAQGRALGLPLRGSPIFVARISPPREMIKHGRRGDKMASKAKRRGPITGSPPNGTGSPGSPPVSGASFRSGETTLMLVDPSECRQHALDCVRLAQTATTPEARKTWSDLAKTWLRFATEANESLLDEWGRPKTKSSEPEE